MNMTMGEEAEQCLLVVNKETERKPSSLGRLKVSPFGWEKGARGQPASSSEDAESLTLVLHIHLDPNPAFLRLHPYPFPSLPHLQRLQWRRLDRGPGLGRPKPRERMLLGRPSRGVSWLWGNNRTPSPDACWGPQLGPPGLRSQGRLARGVVVGFASLGCWSPANAEPRCSPGKGLRVLIFILLLPVSVQTFPTLSWG